MGNALSENVSDVSSFEDDSDFDTENVTTDAALTIAPSNFPPTRPQDLLTEDKLNDIEQALDEDEVVSIIFLLYDSADLALQQLEIITRGGGKIPFLRDWSRNEQHYNNKWQDKLLEALCVIQNYRILRELGCNKQDSIDKYLPQLDIGCLFLSKFKKMLYRICEKLTNAQVAELVNLVKKDLKNEGLIFKTYEEHYLEMYLLHWQSIGYITNTNLNKLMSHFKVMELCNLNDTIKKVLPPKKEPRVVEKQKVLDNAGVQNQSTLSIISDVASLHFVQEDDKYDIDVRNPGICLIINQEHFYTEFDEKYTHLVPNDQEKLEERHGTAKDQEELEKTFKSFGFTVIVKNDRTHEEMINDIDAVLKSVDKESSVFICILSHGDRDVVYGCNSCKVEVSEIQRKLCKTNKAKLKGKPKVLILQSCQGQLCQELNEEDSESEDGMVTDGKQTVPDTVDVLTFWATIPGFAALRDKKRGTWFIQSLCAKMIEHHLRKHFADICTSIVNDVTSKKYGEKVMTPFVTHTFRKSLYLPPQTT